MGSNSNFNQAIVAASMAVAVVGTFAALGNRIVRGETTVIRTQGHTTPGLGAATYQLSQDQVSGPQPWRKATKNGRWFELAEPSPNASMFGAIPDLAVDSTAAFTALAKYSALTGLVGYLPKGDFAVADVRIPSKAQLVGPGLSLTRLVRSGAPVTGIVVLDNYASNVLLQGFSIDGLSASDTKGLLYLGSLGNNLSLLYVGFVNAMQSSAVRAFPDKLFHGFDTIGCYWDNCPFGAWGITPISGAVRGSYDINFDKNRIERAGSSICALNYFQSGEISELRHSFYFNANFTNNVITNCLNTGSDGPIPQEWWGVQKGSFSYNYIDSGTRGLSAGAWSDGVTITGNVVKNQTTYFAEASFARGVKIFKNWAINCATFYADTGKFTLDVAGVEIEGNECRGTGIAAYNSGAPTDYVSIGNSGTSLARDWVLRNNKFYDIENSRSVIRLHGQNPAPTLSFTGGGTGATATITLKGVRGRVTNYGSRYASAPVATFMSRNGAGSGMTGDVTIDAAGRLASLTITNPGSGYTMPPQIILSGGGGIDGVVEAVMGVETVTPTGGAGYADGTFSITGNGGTVAATGTFTQTGGVPNAATVLVAGEGFGRWSSFEVTGNTYEARTYASAVPFMQRAAGNLRSSFNRATRRAYMDSNHYQASGPQAVYGLAGADQSQNNPLIESRNDTAEMFGEIKSGGIIAAGSVRGAAPQYGLKLVGFTMKGLFSASPITIADNSGSTLIEDMDVRECANTNPYAGINASILVRKGETAILPSAGGTYYPLAAARPKQEKVALHYQGSPSTQAVKVRCEVVGAGMPAAKFIVRFAGAANNTVKGGTVELTYCTASDIQPPLAAQISGDAVSIASVADGSGRMETTITMPAGSNQRLLIDVEASVDGQNNLAAMSSYSVRVG